MSVTSESNIDGFYCPTCNMTFEMEEQMKTHYHSDIHNYNMKRKIVGLKAVDEPTFKKRTIC